MTSKPKFGFKGLVSITNRTTEKVKEKVGRAEETVDVQFNQERDAFDTHYKHLKKLSKDLSDYTKSLRAISDAHSAMGTSISVFYDSGSSLYETNQRYLLTVGDIDKARQALDETLHIDIVAPVDLYLGQYRIMDKRIDERNRRRLEMDRYRLKVRKYMSHPPEKPEKLTEAEANYNMWKAAYTDLNSELITDIHKLLADKCSFFDPCFATIILASARYYQEVAAIATSLVPLVQHIDPKVSHQTHDVIIPEEDSAANRTYESEKKAGMKEHIPSYQQPPSYALGGGYGQPSYNAPPSQPGYGAPGGQPSYNAPPSQPAGAPYGGPQGGGPSAPYGRPQGGGPSAPFGGPQGGGPSAPGRPGPQPPRRPAEQARALYAFNAEAPNELRFQPGQVMTIISKNGDWWEAELNGRRGLIPANYVQLL